MNRILKGLAAAAAVVAAPVAANAYTAYATADLNLRACGSTSCPAIAVIPYGAPVNVLGTSGGWSYVSYAGIAGYASASYITTQYAYARPPVVVRRAPVVYPPVVGYPAYPYGYYPTMPWGGPFFGSGFSITFGFRS